MTEDLYLRFAALLAAALLVPSGTFAMFAVAHRDVMLWRYASAGLFCIFFASSLSAAKDVVPTGASFYVSNALVCVGYFLTVKSLRYAYSWQRWKTLDMTILVLYLGAVFLINSLYSSYEARVVLVSSAIMTFSVLVSLVVYFSENVPSRKAAVMLVGFSIFNSAIAAARLVAALPNTDEVFPLAFWDPVFFIWSIAATFLFALAQFINGNAFIQQKHIQALQEAKRRLARERELSHKLAKSNEEQQNLQKLLLHEFKRPLAALHAALQVSDTKNAAIEASRLTRLRTLTAQANTYLEGIAQYQDISELFEALNWSWISVSEIVKDISTKWSVDVMADSQLEGKVLSCDPLLVDIAISNLIENAQKFSSTPAGVSVRLDLVDGKLRLDVQDDGPGIPEAEWKNIWQKFYKLDGETANTLTGCGLGLHIVDEIAKAHSGRTYVVSQEPSVVRLELPLAAGSGADE